MADGDFARLLVTLEASTKAYERQLAKAQGTTVSALRKMEKEAADSAKRFDTALASGLGGFRTALGVIGSLAAAAGLGTLGQEFERLAKVADDSQKIGITAELLQALQFAASQAGGSADEMTAALIKFNKAVGESGDKSSELGKLFKANGIALRDQSGALLPVTTLLQSYARLVANAASDQEAAAVAAIGFGKAGAGMVPVLRDMAQGLSGVEGAAQKAGVVVDEELVKRAGIFADKWEAATLRVKVAIGSMLLGIPEALDRSIAAAEQSGGALTRRLAMGRLGAPGYTTGGTMDDYQPDATREANRAAALSNLPRWVPPARSTVLPPPGGGGSGGDKTNEYEREKRSIEEKIVALEAEAAAIGKTAYEQEKAKVAAELLNAARRAHMQETPALLENIDQEAARVAALTVKVDQLKKAQTDLIARLDAVRSTAGSTLGSFVNDLAEGTTAAEALKTAIDSIRTALLNALANQLIYALLGAPGTAGAGLFSGLFGGGRAAGGNVVPGRSYRVGERGPETIVPLSRARVVPDQPGVRPRPAGPSMTFNYAIDASDQTDPRIVARFDRQLLDHEARLRAITRQPEAQRRGASVR